MSKYAERSHVQLFAWAEGRPFHNTIDDECCPDFSCCYPDLFVKDETERWATYKGSVARIGENYER